MVILSIGLVHLCIENYKAFYINVTKRGVSIHFWIVHLDLDSPFYNHGPRSKRTYRSKYRESSRGD